MPRFQPSKLQFGKSAKQEAEQTEEDEADNGEGLPTPFKTRQLARRWAGIKEAKDVLTILPGPNESLHAVCTARMDLSDVLNVILDKGQKCKRMLIATLGYNQRNLTAMVDWLDTGKVKSLTLLCSLFFRAHKRGLWEDTLKQFRDRGQRAAACHSHAKVVSMRMADGTCLSIEGSANMCGNGSGREQFAMFNDEKLSEWHATWIGELVSKHEAKTESAKAE